MVWPAASKHCCDRTQPEQGTKKLTSINNNVYIEGSKRECLDK